MSKAWRPGDVRAHYSIMLYQVKQIRWLVVLVLLVGLTGCAKTRNYWAAQGGVFASHNGAYVVRNDSGGRIMDVWVLPDAMVQAEESGSGWLFRDTDDDVIHLGGDVKVIRVKERSTLKQYHDYHAEFEQELSLASQSRYIPPTYSDQWLQLEKRYGKLPRLNAPEWAAYAGLAGFHSRNHPRGEPVDPERERWRQEKSRRSRAIQIVNTKE